MVFGFSGVGLKRNYGSENHLQSAGDDLAQYIESTNGQNESGQQTTSEARGKRDPPMGNGIDLAPHACLSCRKQKRKCSKELPRCHLCSRVSRECNYEDSPSHIPSQTQVLQARVRELEHELNRQQQHHEAQILQIKQFEGCNYATRQVQVNPFDRFPASFFLDHDIFQQARLTIPQPSLQISQDIYQILGTVDNLRKIAGRFFTQIHPWFPILSRKRSEIMLADSDFIPKPEVAGLLVAMHLITNVVSNCEGTVRSNLYWTVKNYLSTLEANNAMTAQLLQANVLLTLYELGHAIYPAAYLSLGKCTAMGKALGLDNFKHAPQMLRRLGSWAEMEEIRRLWWGILVLDR